MDARSKLMCSASVLGFASAALLAVDAAPPGWNTPGWHYARLNCSPTEGVLSADACKDCCRAAERHGLLPSVQLNNCYRFCDIVCYPCWLDA